MRRSCPAGCGASLSDPQGRRRPRAAPGPTRRSASARCATRTGGSGVLQTIDVEGKKRFMGGGLASEGQHAVLGAPGPGEPVVIAEGYATAATIA